MWRPSHGSWAEPGRLYRVGMARLHRAVILSDDLDRSRSFYADAFGFDTIFDDTLPNGFRALHIGSSPDEAGLWLIPVPSGDARLGAQTRPEPALVIEIDDLDAALERLRASGSRIVRDPDGDGTSRFAHVLDDSGNELVLVEFV